MTNSAAINDYEYEPFHRLPLRRGGVVINPTTITSTGTLMISGTTRADLEARIAELEDNVEHLLDELKQERQNTLSFMRAAMSFAEALMQRTNVVPKEDATTPPTD
jgi:hypothetical protein